jgi:hypothetical protein
MYSNTVFTCGLAFSIMYSRILAQPQYDIHYHNGQYHKQ